jgi:hypothetical protein
MTEFGKLVRTLAGEQVAFVLVGGVAATAHGSSRSTLDLDICYARDKANLKRLVSALAPLHPSLRGGPAGLPFLWDAETLRRGLNFTLTTDLGDLDLLGEMSGVGGYDQVRPSSVNKTLFGVECAVLSLPDLIAAKRAAGRTKDLEALVELEALWEAQRPED